MNPLSYSIKFYFIRHGQSESNTKPDIIGGFGDNSKLTNLGKTQAKRLGQYFLKNNLKIDKIYSSNLIRASDTANIFAKEIGFEPKNILYNSAISELKQGKWLGQKKSEIYTLEKISMINNAGYLFCPPNGESQRMVERRFSNWLEDEILQNPDFLSQNQTVAIFSHGVAIACLLHYIMGFNERLVYRFGIANTGFCEFDYTSEGWFPISINSTNHL
jgi:probable phosphoglycerate mutase